MGLLSILMFYLNIFMSGQSGQNGEKTFVFQIAHIYAEILLKRLKYDC